MDYLTTSLLPSGNRLVTEAVCPGLMSKPAVIDKANDKAVIIPRLIKEVDIQSTADALLLGTNSTSETVRWIVGTPSGPTFWWMVLDNGDQYRMTSSLGDDDTSSDDMNAAAVLPWSTVDSADRPLVISSRDSTRKDGNETMQYSPFPQPSITSPLSAAVPTPNGGFLLVQQQHTSTTGNTYQLTQLTANYSDVTHSSLWASALDPLPDASISYSHKHQLWAVYTASTDRYNHAVVGDALEAHALTVLQWNAETESVEIHAQVTLQDEEEEDTVFEGLGVIWADVNGDGQEDLVTTISNRAVGARLRVYTLTTASADANERQELTLLAQAPAIGVGGRWLHQLAVGNLGPQGETEVVEIRTPHIGGIVRYYQWDGSDELQLVASSQRYTSHDIRSRNLDRAVVFDLNGDGIPELVVQNQDKDTLVGLQRTNNNNEGVETVWSIPLSSPVESNLAVGCSSDPDILELLFSTQDQNLVKLQFAPANISGDIDDIVGSRIVDTTSGVHFGYEATHGSLRFVLSLIFMGIHAIGMF
ncbi:Integrins alpha chain [Seminavis robusta]|uniref:Integrins alpha chain n=1 Tax=Seminavis robusta TaxID=568900 RepID=A0A9N8DSN5_9STRA|nr:Integrins alpha chain [Seminavis robusta]|eukprot:Sro250_g099070.1 Integrins alpha chain (532) ;mRNA; r:67935-69530